MGSLRLAGGAGSSRGGAVLDWPGARGAQRACPQVSGRGVGAKLRARCYRGPGRGESPPVWCGWGVRGQRERIADNGCSQ